MSISKQTIRAILFCSFGFALVLSCKGQQTGEDFYKLGLEKYHQSDYAAAVQQWSNLLETAKNTTPQGREFLQKWIEKAQIKLQEKKQ